MNIAVLGSGIVGNTIGNKLIELGHTVKMGSRTPDNEKGMAFSAAHPERASNGTFEDAAVFGELVFNCTSGGSALDVIRIAGPTNFGGKIVIDVTNPLDFSKGMPPSLFPHLSNTTSLGEEIQKALPDAKVVKTFNTTNCLLMVNPASLPGEHDMFLCGNDAASKITVTDMLKNWFGWQNVIDLGDISGARGMEAILPIWVRLYGVFQSPNFNFHIQH